MERWFHVQHLDVERLLAEWRWLYSRSARLLARSAFGDLFMADESGIIWRLDVGVGKLEKVADSANAFHESLSNIHNREEWFAASEEDGFVAKGLIPNETQCIAFDTPLIFCAPGHTSKPYIADLYEHVSFLGEVNHQVVQLPDGSKVKLIVGTGAPDH